MERAAYLLLMSMARGWMGEEEEEDGAGKGAQGVRQRREDARLSFSRICSDWSKPFI